MILETACQQTQSQTEQAQVTAILTMEQLHPVLLCRTDPQIDEPEIGETRRDQQARQSLRVAEMAFMDVEPAAFLVGKEGLNMRALFVELHGGIQIIEIGDQVERLLVLLLPDRQQCDWAILVGSHPSRSNGQELTRRWPQIADVEAHPTSRDQNVR